MDAHPTIATKKAMILAMVPYFASPQALKIKNCDKTTAVIVIIGQVSFLQRRKIEVTKKVVLTITMTCPKVLRFLW